MKTVYPRKPLKPQSAIKQQRTNTGKKTQTQFPKPSKQTYSNEEAAKFFLYWAGLPKEMAEYADVRIYRNWPVIDATLSGRKNKDIRKVTGPCPPEWATGFADQFLHIFGSGDYKLWLYEVGVPGVITVGNLRVRDMENHPPRIDLRELLVNDPSNASYVEGLRLKGFKLPGDPGYSDPDTKQENEEVEQKAVSVLTDQVVKMATTLSDQSRKSSQDGKDDRSITSQAIADMGNTAAREAIAIVSESARNSVQMAQEMAKAQSTGANPIEMFASIADLMKGFRPDPNAPNPMMEVLAQQNAQQAERIEKLMDAQLKFYKEQAERAEERNNPSNPVTLKVEKSLLEQMDEMVLLQDRLLTLRGERRSTPSNGGTEEDEEEKTSKDEGLAAKFMNNLPVIMGGLTTIFGLAAGATYNFAVARSGNGQPMPPQMPGMPQQPQYSQPPVQSAPQSMQVAQPSAHNIPPSVDPMIQVLEQLKEPLVGHFFGTDTDGSTFANWLVTGGVDGSDVETVQGRQYYEGLKNFGPANLKQMLANYPPIWSIIGGHHVKVDEFIQDFCDYDAIWEQMRRDEEEEERKAAMSTAPIPPPSLAVPAVERIPKRVKEPKKVN